MFKEKSSKNNYRYYKLLTHQQHKKLNFDNTIIKGNSKTVKPLWVTEDKLLSQNKNNSRCTKDKERRN